MSARGVIGDEGCLARTRAIAHISPGAKVARFHVRLDRRAMTNNDVLRSLRFALELDNNTLVALIATASEGNVQLPLRQLASMLKNDDESDFAPMPDGLLGLVLAGLIIKNRGKREGAPGAAAAPPEQMTNNRVMRALRIALTLKDSDLVGIFALADVAVSKSELGALFRREDHRNYQPCGDQFLRNFLRGLALWYRQNRASKRAPKP
jgi:uncharacterized protein YehS (DUF1456 family)